MKSKLEKTEVYVLPFPKLMISYKTGIVVLFSSPGQGTVIRPDKHNDIGHYSAGWSMNYFRELDKKSQITLSNE